MPDELHTEADIPSEQESQARRAAFKVIQGGLNTPQQKPEDTGVTNPVDPYTEGGGYKVPVSPVREVNVKVGIKGEGLINRVKRLFSGEHAPNPEITMAKADNTVKDQNQEQPSTPSSPGQLKPF